MSLGRTSIPSRVALAPLLVLATCATGLTLITANHPKKARVQPATQIASPARSSSAGSANLPAGRADEGPEEATARTLNEVIPFVGVGAVASPFRFRGTETARERARDCLASAMWYEAGTSVEGRKAVAQVVLNRVRDFNFPPSVCGVVFEGAERSTGCQFTFTCDGAMRRIPPPALFAKVREEAASALNGATEPTVGRATHYHTDWVHPAWSASLDKVARIDTHLFYRWPHDRAPILRPRSQLQSEEPVIRQMAALSLAHRHLTGEATQDGGLPRESGQTAGSPDASRQVPGAIQVAMDAGGSGSRQAMEALRQCGAARACKLVGTIAGSDGSAVAFLYVRDRRTGVDEAFWDCAVYARANANECLGPHNTAWLKFHGDLRDSEDEARL